MKRVMTAALVLSLLGGTSAFAQQGEWRGRGDGERREARQERREGRQEQRQEQRGEARQEQRREGREQRGEARQQRQERREALPPQRGSPGNPAVAEQLRRQQQQQARQQQEQRRDRDGRPAGDRGERRDWGRDWDRGRDGRNDQRWDRDRDRGEWQRNYRPGQGRAARDRDRGRHWYNPGQWRHSYHAPRRYRAPAYRYPSGWYVRSWVFGDTLPWGWFTPHYYLDWRYYGLPVPPIGTEWVRVGDDALLVDVWTGRVLTVYYDLFW